MGRSTHGSGQRAELERLVMESYARVSQDQMTREELHRERLDFSEWIEKDPRQEIMMRHRRTESKSVAV